MNTQQSLKEILDWFQHSSISITINHACGASSVMYGWYVLSCYGVRPPNYITNEDEKAKNVYWFHGLTLEEALNKTIHFWERIRALDKAGKIQCILKPRVGEIFNLVFREEVGIEHVVVTECKGNTYRFDNGYDMQWHPLIGFVEYNKKGWGE